MLGKDFVVMSKKRKFKDYPYGGDGMFFYHKKTKHPAKQISHTERTWTNRRYTQRPNNMSNYRIDYGLSTKELPVYFHKTLFTDLIYTRGRPLNIKNKKKKHH